MKRFKIKEIENQQAIKGGVAIISAVTNLGSTLACTLEEIK